MEIGNVTTDHIQWCDDRLVLLDQRALPSAVEYVSCHTADDVHAAIRDMVVRGAPAIGITAAYGVVLAARGAYSADRAAWRGPLHRAIEHLRGARPTAVNLMWALDRMLASIPHGEGDPFSILLATAAGIHADDIAGNRLMGDFGAACLSAQAGVLTHCNAGGLATGGYGTALGVIRSGWRDGRIRQVFATETRPWLQGARLTAWELLRDGIDVTLIADSAAAHLMHSGAIQCVITGADRIAANGDAANKIGTYALATLARAHALKFMIAAPLSTIDLATPTGADIPIEQRTGEELTELAGRRIAAPGVTAFNPVFDVTPAHLIDFLVTEAGVIERPDSATIRQLFER